MQSTNARNFPVLDPSLLRFACDEPPSRRCTHARGAPGRVYQPTGCLLPCSGENIGVDEGPDTVGGGVEDVSTIPTVDLD